MVAVIALDTKGVGAGRLERCSVVPSEAVLTGKAEEIGALHLQAEGGKLLIGTWECSAYSEKLAYPENYEFCHVISGRVALTDAGGTTTIFGPGESYIVPKGFDGTFEVLETLRKIYVIVNA